VGGGGSGAAADGGRGLPAAAAAAAAGQRLTTEPSCGQGQRRAEGAGGAWCQSGLRATAVARWRLPAPQAPQGLGGPHAAGLGQPGGVASYGLFCLRGAAWRAYNQRAVRPGRCNAHRRGAGKQVTRFSSTGF
jgi:hypothetical protein